MKLGMARRTVLSLLLVALLVSSAFSAKEPPDKRVIDLRAYRAMQYAFPYPDDTPVLSTDGERTVPAQRLGVTTPSASPGTAIGHTWYDYQHNGSMGRMVETGMGTSAVVHFAWMYLPAALFESREYEYFSYDITNTIQGTVTGLQPPDDYGGYVGLAITNDNRAIVGGHNVSAGSGLAAPEMYWDYGEATAYFGFSARVPSQLQNYEGQINNQEVIWPKFRYVEGPSDTVLHIIAQTSMPDAADPQAIYYFRRVGSDETPGATWEYPPYVIDTIYDISQDIAANDAGKVALVWTANLPCSASDPDTASGYECRNFVQLDNDVYYQLSYDYGATWEPRVNVTHYIETEGTDSYRAYTDLSALLDTGGDLHVVWAASAWPAGSENPGGDAGLFRGRIFHWSENQPFIRTAHSADWDQTECSPGVWNLNAGKMSVSECNGRLYILFVQINDIPAGVANDCAVESNPGYPWGSGNGDLYVTVSTDYGLTWDRARNITNSRTPGCDSVLGLGGPCDNDNWPSMARFGTDYALNPGDNATDVIVPAGGTDNGWYLDVQYINDHSAGGIVQDEGTWQESDVRWFRLACVDAVRACNPIFSPTAVAYPIWVKPGEILNQTVTIENLGNDAFNYTVSTSEVTGNPGWLSTSGFSGSVDYGVNNTGTGVITVDASAESPGTIALYEGYVIFTGNSPTSPDTIKIAPIVTDTIIPPGVDTVSTACLSLAVLNNGEFGSQGIGKVNMDFYDYGDCDTNATVYLYDGSPLVGWIDGADTVMNWSIFNSTYLTPYGFFQQSLDTAFVDGVHQIYSSMFSTRDTSLMLEETYYAPQNSPTDCKYIIQRLRVWSGDGAQHTGLTLGEAVDWDIPSDSGSNNGSGFDDTANLIYQFGGEYHQDDTGLTPACQDSDVRYGGVKFLGMFNKGSSWIGAGQPTGAYTADNATYVYPNLYGFNPVKLYEKMQQTGYSTFSSPAPESTYTDLHTVMTYKTGYTINPGETLVVYTALISEMNGGFDAYAASATAAYDWYCANVVPNPPGCGCCQSRGNVDNLGGDIPNVADLTFLVRYLFQGGLEPPCMEQGNVDGLGGEIPNVADLTYLVRYLFQGGVEPPPCS